MLIAGAGGHALEVLDVLNEQTAGPLFFYDDVSGKAGFREYKILASPEQLLQELGNDFSFILGIGNVFLRKKMFEKLVALGGKLVEVRSVSASISPLAAAGNYDVMKHCFIGPGCSIGNATFINTGAQVHHEVSIGSFCEISPRAVLLGKVSIGDYCSIGANATVLPTITIGSNVIVAAGAVVTENVPSDCMVAGVPASIKKQIPKPVF